MMKTSLIGLLYLTGLLVGFFSTLLLGNSYTVSICMFNALILVAPTAPVIMWIKFRIGVWGQPSHFSIFLSGLASFCMSGFAMSVFNVDKQLNTIMDIGDPQFAVIIFLLFILLIVTFALSISIAVSEFSLRLWRGQENTGTGQRKLRGQAKTVASSKI